MICFDCPHTAICKIFDTVMKSKPYVDIQIKGCQIKLPDNYQSKDSQVVTYGKSGQRTPEELLAVSERIKNADKEKRCKDELPEPDETEDEGELLACGVCEEYIIRDKQICTDCGKTICPVCSVESADDKQTYCTECFEKKKR